jgi:methyl-accepting chemotaxis protein
MQTFRNLRLGTRLGAVFGAIAVGLLVVVVVAATALGSLHRSADTLATEDLPAVKALGQIQFAMVAYRADQLAHAHQTDQAGRADQEQQMGEHAAIMTKAFKAYEGSFISERDRALHKSAQRNWAAYQDASAPFLALSREGRNAEAYAVLKREVAPLVALIGDLDKWIAFAEKTRAANVEQADASYVRARTVLIAVTALVLLLSVAAAAWVTRSVTRPVRTLGDRLRRLHDEDLETLADGLDAAAAGDLTRPASPVTEPVDVVGRDELAELSETFNGMLDQARRGMASYETMRGKLGTMIGHVAANATTVSTASEQMASTSDEAGRAVTEIASAVGDVALGAERQVRMVESVREAAQRAAAVAADSAASARETAEAAAQARTVADEGVDAARVASDAMSEVSRTSQEVTGAIRDLADRSEQIGEIVETITGISAQTNLLALNAAIEAARAGEQGRGFAVVAEEVRKLAEESQTAAASISDLIVEIQHETVRVVGVVEEGARRTEDGVATVERTREALERIGGDVTDMHARVSGIAEAVAEISLATDRMQSDVDEVASVAEQSSASTEQVSASTQETSASAQEIAASATHLATTADELEQLVQQFRVVA